MENVVLSGARDAKLIDFGTVGSLPDVSGGPMPAGAIGKTRYMAPEVSCCYYYYSYYSYYVCCFHCCCCSCCQSGGSVSEWCVDAVAALMPCFLKANMRVSASFVFLCFVGTRCSLGYPTTASLLTCGV